jgi:biopolymer transport protein ExbD/biopolymer transport protein TolR
VAISTGDSKGGVTSEINVTPMIDVMLVLLIIFMIVTPLIAAGFKATLPRGANLDSDPEGKEEVTLGIDAAGNFFLDGRSIAPEALKDQLTAIYAARDTNKVLYFKADNQLKYGRVQEAVEMARTAGVRVLHTVTEPVNSGLFQAEEED